MDMLTTLETAGLLFVASICAGVLIDRVRDAKIAIILAQADAQVRIIHAKSEAEQALFDAENENETPERHCIRRLHDEA